MRAPRKGIEPVIGCIIASLLVLVAGPPFDAWPLCAFALVPLLLALRGRSVLGATLLGWLFGTLVNLGTQSWVSDALMAFAHFSRSSSVVALLCVSLMQGAAFGVFGLGSVLAERFKLSPFLAIPLLFGVCESLVPYVFPWNVGVIAWRLWPLTQVAEVGGAAAVSALLGLINVVVGALVVARVRRAPLPSDFRPAVIWLTAIVTVGVLRAGQVAWVEKASPQLKVAVIQPNVGIVSAEARKKHGDEYLAVMRRVTDAAQASGAELIVWPESSFPYVIDRQADREFAADHPWSLRTTRSAHLLFGSLTHRFGDSVVYNSAVLLTPEGQVKGIYDKRRLLPFGEYIPFKNRYPEWAKRLRADMPDWPEIEAGGELRLLTDGPLRIGALVCYEDVFPMTALHEANVLVTVANHAWFGAWAPRQALAVATLRAIELRRPLVRSTNNGVSSIGDALGRVIAEAPVRDVKNESDGPQTLQATIALLEIPAMGPLTAPLFPWVCGALLAALVLRGHRRASRDAQSGKPPHGAA